MVVTSYQLNNANNQLFHKNKRQKCALVLALIFSIILMFFDDHRRFKMIHDNFSLIVSPFQYTVDYPIRFVGLIQSLFNSKRKLINENIKLHYQQTILESELQKLMAIKKENSQLKQLLLTASKAKMKTMAAQILAVDTGNSRQLLILDKGKRDGVYVDQPVLDAKGVMGQVIDVGYMTSTVLLISDIKCAVPVRDNRTGEQAILVGTNNINQLSLINLPHTAKIAKGDLLVTSGRGRLYPEGYPVGYIEKITALPSEAFVKIDVTPVAFLSRNRLALLIWPGKEHAKLTQQIHERISSIEKKLT